MTIQRLIDQLTHAQREYGELTGIIVHSPAESEWCDPPLPKAAPSYDCWAGDQRCYIWRESSSSDALQEVARLCPSLCDLPLPDGLREWRLPCSTDDSILQWLWIVGGFAITPLPGRTPRAKRFCWGLNGHKFEADRLESRRKKQNPTIVKAMPPDAECWMIRIDNILQVSVEMLEGLLSDAWGNVVDAVGELASPVADEPPTDEPMLKASDPKAQAFMDGKNWCTAYRAKKRFGVEASQLTKASTSEKGLFKVVVERKRAQVGEGKKGIRFVYHFGSLQLLKDAIDKAKTDDE